ncbi:MAG: BMC domain-containing protein, partial [Clostridia bacterium]|nr:BMC domain-containing protein [Clostridia bacterium]
TMALGMIECFGFVTSVVVADKGLKTADVELVAIDKNKPANADKCEVPLVMVVKFEGNVAAVEMAVEAGKQEAEKRGMFIASRIIPRQDEQIEWFARLNALGKSSTI